MEGGQRNLGFEHIVTATDMGKCAPGSWINRDEGCIVQPVQEFISASEKPFFLMILTSVTHLPYDGVPKEFTGLPYEEIVEMLPTYYPNAIINQQHYWEK